MHICAGNHDNRGLSWSGLPILTKTMIFSSVVFVPKPNQTKLNQPQTLNCMFIIITMTTQFWSPFITIMWL